MFLSPLKLLLPFKDVSSCSSVLGILNSPFSSILEKPSGYLSHDSMSMTADFLEKFPGIARMANRPDCSSLLDSRSSSPEDSETSGFSSGSDHLCDMLVSLIPLCAAQAFMEYLARCHRCFGISETIGSLVQASVTVYRW